MFLVERAKREAKSEDIKGKEMYLHSAELNVVAGTENVNTFLLV